MRISQKESSEKLDVQNGLPEYLTRPRRRIDWDMPTAWLLGTKLIGALKSLVLSSVDRGTDLRDWMTAAPITIEYKKKRWDEEMGSKTFWFDYLADSGDSAFRTYRLARALQRPEIVAADANGKAVTLPRGDLLVFGGDTAYPTAARVTLVERVCAPFYWAYQDVAAPAEKQADVQLFAVAGNHDWYDRLDGFARQFTPAVDVQYLPIDPPQRQMPLDLKGYDRKQQASYFSVSLPFDWQLFGIDAEFGIDAQQVDYFRKQIHECPPKKLIYATSRPLIVQQSIVPDDDSIAAAGRYIREPWTGDAKQRPDWAREVSFVPDVYKDLKKLPEEHLRLDLSGDTHTYERYYGASCPEVQPLNPKAQAHPRYASVVCGLGGAFPHPSGVVHGSVLPQHVHPPVEDSARAIGKALTNPGAVFRAGAGGLIGLLLALVLFAIAALHNPTRTERNVLDAPHGWLSRRDLISITEPLLLLGGLAVYALVGFGVVTSALWWERRSKAKTWAAPTARSKDASTLRQAFRFLLAKVGVRPRALELFARTAIPRALVIAWTAAPFVAWFAWSHGPRWHAEIVARQVGATVLVGLIIGAFGGLGWSGGWSTPSKLLNAVLGVLHGIFQVWTPYLWIGLLENRLEAAAIAVAVILATAICVFPRALLLTGLARRFAITIAGVAVFAALLVTPIVLTGYQPAHWGLETALGVAGLGALFACLQLGWYALVVLQWNAHSNLAGVIARLESYGTFLRICLRENSAEVWAIATSEDDKYRFDGKVVTVEDTLRVIDHFKISLTSTDRAQ